MTGRAARNQPGTGPRATRGRGFCIAAALAVTLAVPAPLLSQPITRPAGTSAPPEAEHPAPAPRPGSGVAAVGSASPQPAPSRPEPRPDSPPPPAPLPAGETSEQPAADEAEPAPDVTPAPPDAEIMPAPEPAPSDAAPPVHQTLRESDFDHAACRLGLRLLGVEAVETDPVTDPGSRDCGIGRPVEIRALLPGLTVEGGPVMRCDTARSLALWMREAVIPAARRLEGSPRVTSVALGTSYACRGVVGGASTATVSEHALGNAVDIAGFGFDDGTRLEIAPRGDRGGIEMAFQNAVQAAACLYFTTVLGPGSNAAHDDHLHLDIKARNNGFRLCQ